MKVLVACEESQRVCKAFRYRGHEAYSCDLLKCSGAKPQWHLQQDVIPLLDKYWDLIIAFPPCTDLSYAGIAQFAQKEKDGRQQAAIDFFMKFINARCHRIAVENPKGIINTIYRKPDQIIQPWMFGHGETKATCLWLKNLPKLKPTNIVKERFNWVNHLPETKDRALIRSKTYFGQRRLWQHNGEDFKINYTLSFIYISSQKLATIYKIHNKAFSNNWQAI